MCVQEFDTVKQFIVTVAIRISLVASNTYHCLTNSMKKGSSWVEDNSRRDIREIPCLLQNRWVDNAFRTAHYRILSWPRCIQSTPQRHVSLRFILTLFFYTCFGHPFNCFPSDFPAKILYAYLISPRLAKCVFHTPWFAQPNNIWWRLQIMKTGIVQFFFYNLL